MSAEIEQIIASTRKYKDAHEDFNKKMFEFKKKQAEKADHFKLENLLDKIACAKKNKETLNQKTTELMSNYLIKNGDLSYDLIHYMSQKIWAHLPGSQQEYKKTLMEFMKTFHAGASKE